MNRHALLSEFLEQWPLKRLKTMSIDEYVLGGRNSNDSFCYWVETILIPLGNIKGLGGGGSFKFGIFKKVSGKKYDSNKYIDDGEYAWQKAFGLDRDSAFEEIRSRIVSIVEAVSAKNYHEIDHLKDIFTLVKWKVAFLYSHYELIPVYKREWLMRIAKALGMGKGAHGIADLQLFIMQRYNHSGDFFDWYEYLLRTHIRAKNRFYIIGSQYYDVENKRHISQLTNFYEKSVIATNFGPNISLESYYGASKQSIAAYLNKLELPQKDISAIKCFLSLRPGDKIAVKEFGIPGRLKIASYAEVVAGKDGKIYSHDPENLGHSINVRFIETNSDFELPYSKRHTAHEITDLYEIDEIFGVYQNGDSGKVENNGRNGVQTKNTGGYWRSGTAGRWVNQYHNALQQAFFDQLKSLKNDTNGIFCKMEEDYIDVFFDGGKVIELYEVKPFPSPKKCLRESIGQLLAYSHSKVNKLNSRLDNIEIRLIIVGPNDMQEQDVIFLDYLKARLIGVEIFYQSFN